MIVVANEIVTNNQTFCACRVRNGTVVAVNNLNAQLEEANERIILHIDDMGFFWYSIYCGIIK